MQPHQQPGGHHQHHHGHDHDRDHDHYHNHRSLTRRASFSDDEDAITPCCSPPPEPQELDCSTAPATAMATTTAASHAATTTAPASLASFKMTPTQQHKASLGRAASSSQTRHFDPTDGQDLTDSQLWQRMLEIQKTFHCYNSARMSAALLELDMGVDAGHLAPSRSCLDLMNESIADLNEQERQRLAEWVHEHSSANRKKSGSWRRIIHSWEMHGAAM